MVESEITGTGRINRPESSGTMKRRSQKLTCQSNWFKKAPKEDKEPQSRKRKSGTQIPQNAKRAKVESVLFVPHTPGSEYCRIQMMNNK